jgi:hypothetical protein
MIIILIIQEMQKYLLKTELNHFTNRIVPKTVTDIDNNES